MLVGAYSALTPWIFKFLPVALAPLYEPGSILFASVRFLVVFLILLPASAGMGATLPLVTAALSRSDRSGGSVAGRLYGLNTLGAFFGTLTGGFVMLPGLGLQKTILAAAGTSFGVGLLDASDGASRRGPWLRHRPGCARLRRLPFRLGIEGVPRPPRSPRRELSLPSGRFPYCASSLFLRSSCSFRA